MREELVSIIVPVYNVENYLEKCIHSIRNQDYQNIEIILVDDGSPDKSPDIVDGAAKEDKRIKVIHKSNGGVSSARNAGMDAATGEFIMFVDGDDWVEPDYVSYFLHIIKSRGCPIGMNKRKFYINESYSNNTYRVETAERAMIMIYMNDIDVAVWNKIYRTDFIRNHDLKFRSDVWYGEGMLFNIHCLQYCDNVVVGEKAVYHQTFNPNSAMRKFNLESNYCGIKSLEIQRSLWKKASKELEDSWLYHRFCFNRTIIDGMVRTGMYLEKPKDYQNAVSELRKNIGIGLRMDNNLVGIAVWGGYFMAPKLMARLMKKRCTKQVIAFETRNNLTENHYSIHRGGVIDNFEIPYAFLSYMAEGGAYA